MFYFNKLIIKIIIRKWKLYLKTKKITFNKYKCLYNEMWNIYTNKLCEVEKQQDDEYTINSLDSINVDVESRNKVNSNNN